MKLFIKSLLLGILLAFSVGDLSSQTVIKNRITVDSVYFEGRGITSDPLTLKADALGGELPYYEVLVAFIYTGVEDSFRIIHNTFPGDWTLTQSGGGPVILYDGTGGLTFNGLNVAKVFPMPIIGQDWQGNLYNMYPVPSDALQISFPCYIQDADAPSPCTNSTWEIIEHKLYFRYYHTVTP